jgi:hypothetical protein
MLTLDMHVNVGSRVYGDRYTNEVLSRRRGVIRPQLSPFGGPVNSAELNRLVIFSVLAPFPLRAQRSVSITSTAAGRNYRELPNVVSLHRRSRTVKKEKSKQNSFFTSKRATWLTSNMSDTSSTEYYLRKTHARTPGNQRIYTWLYVLIACFATTVLLAVASMHCGIL